MAVLMTVFYIYMIARPVAVGMTYEGKVNLGVTKVEAIYKINNSRKLTQITEHTEVEYSYFVKGREIVIFLGHEGEMSNSEYKELKEKVLKNWGYYEQLGWVNSTSAFKLEKGGDEFISSDSIIFAVLGGIVTVAFITLAAFSIVVSTTKTKNKKK